MPEGEVITAGLGLALGAGRPGEGEDEALSNGFLRHRALPVHDIDMLPIRLWGMMEVALDVRASLSTKN